MPLAVVGAVLLLCGAAALALGVLPAATAADLGSRILPVLGFVAAISVVAELLNAAGVFDVAASAIRRVGRGSGWALWLLTCALAVASTAFLSLDTTAVLVTPVVVLLARAAGLRPLPFALATIWLANTASLFLPISNLTNLLAAQHLPDAAPAAFAARMAAPAIVAVLLPMLVLAIIFHKDLGRASLPPTGGADRAAGPAPPIPDRMLLAGSTVVLALLLPALVLGPPPWLPATSAAVLLVIAFAIRRPTALKPALIPWSLLLFASGLFLAVATAEQLGLQGAGGRLLGSGDGTGGLLRTAAAGAVGANAINNLPAYLVLESGAGSPTQLMALLIGVNVGPLITPWASLATLLWHDRLARMGLAISWWRYAGWGLLGAPLTVGATTWVLWLGG